MPLRALLLAITALLIAAPTAGAITVSTDPTTLANSALRSPSSLSSASWDMSGALAGAVATESLQGFPAHGSDYLVLSSGDAGLAPSATQGTPNNTPNANVSNGGGTRGGAKDVSVLRLNLTVPSGNNCVSLKFRYFSEEFPEFLNQGYNDGFLAELDPSAPWTMTSHQISAPANFAFMPGGAFVSINSATLTAGAGVGTVYDGGTQLLTAATPVTPGTHALVLSVWDDGDDKYDSAAFVDDIRIFTAQPGGCVAGAQSVVADSTAPDTTLTTTPPATSGASAGFDFSADESASFECRVDGGAWTACAGPYSATGLTSGGHTFEVRAIDDAGNVDGTPASYSWTVDATAPQTTVTGGPSGTTASTSASFTPGADKPGSTFECKLDAGAWLACTDPASYSSLTDGSHTLAVRATDTLGNVDGTPATHTWTVDTTAPNTSITSGPNPPTASNAASFAFTSEPGASFECQIDGGSWASCTSPVSYSSLVDGPHTVLVRASDSLGNVDATPASRSWTVDTTAPNATIDTAPPAVTSSTTAAFTFSSEPGATFECRIDGGTWTVCTSPASYSSLTDGQHTVQVRALDAVGNADASPATHTWTVDTGAPAAPGIDLTSAPAPLSSDPNPAIAFTGEPGATFECRVDGGAWTPCTSPLQLNGLTDGSHTVEIRQTDSAANQSPSSTHTWTIDTTRPAAPAILAGPVGQTTETTAPFAFAGEPGATLECRVEGGAWAPCSDTLDLKGLATGEHVIEVRQIDAAGNVSDVATRRWTVVAVAPPTTGDAPVTFTGTVGVKTGRGGKPTAVASEGRVPVGCAVGGGAIESCKVQVFVGGKLVGTGVAQYGGEGVKNGRVEVKLSRAVRAKLAKGGRVLKASFVFRAAPAGGGKALTSRKKVTLAPRAQWILASDGLFESGRARLMPKVRRYLRAIAPDVRTARTVRVEGHTDALGTTGDNYRLGLRRAKTVVRELRRLGVDARLLARSRGESRPRATNDTLAGRWSNRRVELRVLR